MMPKLLRGQLSDRVRFSWMMRVFNGHGMREGRGKTLVSGDKVR